jgi:hypothetical protein
VSWRALAVRSVGAAAVIGLVVGAVSLRVVAAGEAEIAASTAALRAGDARDAAAHARRAAGWYAPGAPHVRVAYERLIALASASEGLGDRDLALFAWRGVRTASLETRWLFGTPHAGDRARADAAIARLEATSPRAPGTRTDPTPVVERKALEALARDEAPRTVWVAALVAAFVAWTTGAAAFVARGVDASGRLVSRRAWPAAGVAAAGIGVWLLAIWRA